MKKEVKKETHSSIYIKSKNILFLFFVLFVFLSYSQDKKDLIQTLEQDIKQLISVKNWGEADKLIKNNYREDPSHSPEYTLVKRYTLDKYKDVVKEAILGEKKMYQRLKNNKSLYSAESYLDKYPYGIYKKEVINLIKTINAEKEDKIYQKIKNDKSLSLAKSYLDEYPSGRYKKQVQNLIETINTERENEIYQKIKNDKSLSLAKYYLRKYPSGRYRKNIQHIINKIIAEDYYTKGNSSFDNKRYSEAISYYEKYLSILKYGNYHAEAKNRIAESKLYIEKEKKIKRRKEKGREILNTIGDIFLWIFIFSPSIVLIILAL